MARRPVDHWQKITVQRGGHAVSRGCRPRPFGVKMT